VSALVIGVNTQVHPYGIEFIESLSGASIKFKKTILDKFYVRAGSILLKGRQ